MGGVGRSEESLVDWAGASKCMCVVVVVMMKKSKKAELSLQDELSFQCDACGRLRWAISGGSAFATLCRRGRGARRPVRAKAFKPASE